MKKTNKKLITHIVNVVTIALIVECFLCAMLLVRKYGRENCFVRIEEITQQVSQMFAHAMEENQNNLTVFADILAANDSNPEDHLLIHMENFCDTQDFDAVCIHRKNGTFVSYGKHPHDQINLPAFHEEVSRLPYTSDVYGSGNSSDDLFVYQAVPIVRNGETIAVLYGYLTLDTFPHMISSTAYGGKGQFYIVNGSTGNILMDATRSSMGNVFDGSFDNLYPKTGYDIEEMKQAIRQGESGYFVCAFQPGEPWYYTYYTPIGINNWSMQMTIDEDTAFSSYHMVNRMLMVLAFAVIVLMVVHVLVLMREEQRNNRKDKHNLHKSNYINEVQRILINAHTNPDHIGQALKIIAGELDAETVILLAFSGQLITDAQYWPSKDRPAIMDLLGRNIRNDFPTLYDILFTKESVIYDSSDPSIDISETAKLVFRNWEVRNMMLVPIMDNAGAMKGAIAAVNTARKPASCEMLECITYDFFMALSNLENQNIIRRMGTMDYLTNTKNRNCFEAELSSYAVLDCENLWCVFVDVNGLHEVNNSQGHKAGDVMLCTVADAIKNVFGEKHTFRLGGDEFVTFVENTTLEALTRSKERISKMLAGKGYYISIGFSGIEKNEGGQFEIERVVSDAELIMYQDKWSYYQTHGIPAERGHFPKIMKQTTE